MNIYTLIETRHALLDAYSHYLSDDGVIELEVAFETTPKWVKKIYEKEKRDIRDRASKPSLRKPSIHAKKGRGKVHKRGGTIMVHSFKLSDVLKDWKEPDDLSLKVVHGGYKVIHHKNGLGQRAKSSVRLSGKKPSDRKRSVRHGASPQKGGGAQKRGAKGGIKS